MFSGAKSELRLRQVSDMHTLRMQRLCCSLLSPAQGEPRAQGAEGSARGQREAMLRAQRLLSLCLLPTAHAVRHLDNAVMTLQTFINSDSCVHKQRISTEFFKEPFLITYVALGQEHIIASM